MKGNHVPARANVVISDGKATPVAHTFNPAEEGELDLFEDRVGGIPIGFPVIVVRFRRPPSAQAGGVSDATKRAYKVMLNLHLPVLEVTSPSTGTGIQPAPTVAYICRFNSEWVLPERSTLADRKDLRALAYNLLANADIRKVLEDLEAYW